jgi:hypothetical protein
LDKLQQWVGKHRASLPVLKVYSGLASSRLSQLPGTHLQELVLHSCNLLLPTALQMAPGSSSSSSIVSGLSLATQLSTVDIQHCVLEVGVWQPLQVSVATGQFLSTLAALPALQQLSLCNNMVQGKHCGSVTHPLALHGSFLQPVQQLLRLDLQQQLSGDRELLQNVGHMTKLQQLRLAGLTDMPLCLADADFGDLSALSSLERLQLHNVSLRSDSDGPLAAAAAQPRAGAFMSWLQQQQELTCLQLRGVEGLDNEHARERGEYLPSGAYRALTSSSVLRQIDLRGSHLGMDAYQRAFPALRKVASVTELSLSGSKVVALGSNHHHCIESAIRGCPNLQAIVVEGPMIWPPEAAYQAMAQCNTLTSITVGCPHLKRPSTSVHDHVGALTGFTQLRRLHLTACGFLHTSIPDFRIIQDDPVESQAERRLQAQGRLLALKGCFQKLRSLVALTQLTQLSFTGSGQHCSWPAALADAWDELAGASTSAKAGGIVGSAQDEAPRWMFVNKVR